MREQLVLAIFSAVLLILYHLRLYYLLRKRPTATSIGIANERRTQWIERVMNEDKDILAVQTLRNLTMAASFLASTAIMLGLAVMNALLGDASRADTLRALATDELTPDKLWVFKLMILAATFAACFYNFMLAIRYYNHTGVFTTVYPSEDNVRHLHKPGLFIDMANLPKVHVALRPVAETFNRGAAHYTLGMRGYYLAFPLSLWLFGSGWFLIGTIVLMVLLSRIDSAG